MLSIEEMTAWDEDQIQAEIQARLPPGHRFVFGVEAGSWCARFYGPEGVVWESSHYEARVLLFNAFGWLWKPPPRVHASRWRPHGGHRLVPVGRSAQEAATPDPEDLDPVQVSAVYGDDTKRS